VGGREARVVGGWLISVQTRGSEGTLLQAQADRVTGHPKGAVRHRDIAGTVPVWPTVGRQECEQVGGERAWRRQARGGADMNVKREGVA
jgi:hypothetical protein